MDITTYFRAQAHNNAWANYRLLIACGKLTQTDLALERTGFFPSIIQTLNHNLVVDRFYVSALEGAPLNPAVFRIDIPFPVIFDLVREQKAVDQRLMDYCENLNADQLSGDIQIKRTTGIQTEPADRILLHLFQHQIHHRGQTHCMLSGTNVSPPQLDEFFPATEEHLRKEDFATLGFSESVIWR